jgi:hypothetical protein
MMLKIWSTWAGRGGGGVALHPVTILVLQEPKSENIIKNLILVYLLYCFILYMFCTVVGQKPFNFQCKIRSVSLIMVIWCLTFSVFLKNTYILVISNYELSDRGLESPQGQGVSLSSTISKRFVLPTQPPIQGVHGAKRPEFKAVC